MELNIRNDTIKFLEEIIGKTSPDIYCTNVFLGQTPKATEIKTKINKWDLMKCTGSCTANEMIRKDNLDNGKKCLQTMQPIKA